MDSDAWGNAGNADRQGSRGGDCPDDRRGARHAESPAALERQAIGEIVREYLPENPEVVEQALPTLRTKREAAARKVVRSVIGTSRDAIFSHLMTPVTGDPRGDVTPVEFFGYQRGYSKRALVPLNELLASHGKLRVAWKEFPRG